MIIPNGYIRILHATAGGLDAAGFPVGATESQSELIPCQYRAAKMDLAGRDNSGEPHIIQSYTILIADNGKPFRDERIVLYDSYMMEVGTYEVTRIQPLPAVSQVRLYI